MSNIYKFTGPPENWITGISIGKWALNENNRGAWEKLKPGDIALLHSSASSPYSSKITPAIIGYAVIADQKWVKNEAWWVQEKESGENMWPYVFTLDELYLFRSDLKIDFDTDITDKTTDQISSEIQALAASGIPVSMLNARAKEIEPGVPNFNVLGSVSSVHQIYEKLILSDTVEFYSYAGAETDSLGQRLAEEIDENLSEQDASKILNDARNFKPAGEGYVHKEGVYVVRKDNEQQKRRIASIEDYTCQVCGFKCEYTRSSGKPGWIIDVDHIVDKRDGGTEIIDNLWTLCPNCHRKKTRGVIKVDTAERKVYERGKPIKIRDNHLGW